jgi:histone H1/5
MLGATGQQLMERWKELATQAGTRVARAVVETTVVAMKALDRLRARWLKGSPRLHPERLQAIERLWEETVAPSPKMAGAVGPEASAALRRESAEKTRPVRRQPRRKPQPREEGRKTVQAPAPAGKRTTAPAPQKKAVAKKAAAPKAAAPKAAVPKAAAPKKQAPRRRS